MKFLNIPSYVTLAESIPFDLLTYRVCSFAIISITLASLLWFVHKKITKHRNIRIAKATAFNDLHAAVFDNDVIRSYRIIKKYPAAINIPHIIDGYTPFMRACLNGNTQLVRIMLNYGADITHTSIKGETPFYLAVYYYIQNPRIKDASCIHTLYYSGADVNVANNHGYAPIHLAVMFGHTQLVQWLLNKGARLALQPDPIVLARLQGHYETAVFLEQRRLPALA